MVANFKSCKISDSSITFENVSVIGVGILEKVVISE